MVILKTRRGYSDSHTSESDPLVAPSSYEMSQEQPPKPSTEPSRADQSASSLLKDGCSIVHEFEHAGNIFCVEAIG